MTGSPEDEPPEDVDARLRQSEARYRGLVELAPVGIAIHAGGKFVYVNETGARILGAVSPAEILGTAPLDLVHPEDRPLAAARISQVIAQRAPTPTTSMRFLRRDGSTIIVNIAAAPGTYDGQPASQMVFSDVSAQRQADLELIKLRKAVEASGEIVFLTDREGTFTYVNSEFCRVYGWTAEEVVGCATPRIIKSGRMTPEQIAGFWRTILGKQVVRGEYANATRDGSIIEVDGSASPILGDDGSIIGFLGVQRDITRRKSHEAQMRRTQYSVDHAGDAVFWVDSSGSVVYANLQASVQLGYSPEELVGMPVGAFDPAFGPTAWPSHWEEIKARRALRVETVHMAKGGRRIPVDICVNHVEFDGVEYAFAFARDITVQKELAAQFQHAQKMEAVGRLAGGVAHDFNNLLSVILAYADLTLEELNQTDPLRGDIEEIRRAAERAASVARQLLVFSRRDAPNAAVIDVNGVIADLEKLLRRLIGEDVQLVTVPAADLWPVRMDPGQLEQVLANLAINSRDAMPSGGQLVITTTNVEAEDASNPLPAGLEAGRYVVLEVRDAGCGMSPEVAALAFDPFFTTKPAGKGTGLGLSMVYGIVKQVGGSVSLQTAPGRGTTIGLYLPAHERPVSAGLALESPAVVGGAGQTILVVEDDDAVRTLVTRILLRAGYRVQVARNAGEALLIGERPEERIDLILTDVVMPHMSGPELAARLGVGRPHTPVLYMSGYEDNALSHDGALNEGLRLLKKPFTREALLTSVSAALDRGQPASR